MDTQHLLATHLESDTIRNHRRQTFWQVLFPVLLAGLVLIAILILLIITTSARGNVQDTHWANISLIWLIIPTLASSLIFLMLLAGLIFLLAKLLGVLPKYGALGQYYAARMVDMACSLSAKVSSPILSVNSATAGSKEFINKIRQGIRQLF